MKPKLEVEIPLEIPLRYYRGWTINFNTKTETFASPCLCLFGFLTSKDLEKAIDTTGRAQ